LRLRWPNDLLVGDRKVAGVLLERPAPDRVVVGIGVNLKNSPAERDAGLEPVAASLKNFLKVVPEPEQLCEAVLQGMEAAYGQYLQEGFAAFRDRINRCWDGERSVALVVDKETVEGIFVGVDEAGNPCLRDADGTTRIISGPLVWQLKELKSD